MTSMSAPPSEWERLGNVHYHRRHLYSFSDVHVDGRNCAAAVNGGAFAVRSSAEKSANAAADSTRHAQQFTVYSASGVHLCDIAYQSSCELVAHGWTGEELLVCVHGDGRVVVHDLGGRKVRDARLSFSRREDEEKSGARGGAAIVRCEVWGGGIVAATSAGAVFLVADVHTEAPRVTRTKEDASARGAVSALHARVTPEGTAEAIFARGDLVFAARERGVRSRRFAGGAPVRLCASPSGRFLTVFTSLGKMLVVTADLSETATEFDAKAATPPEQVAWCGDDAAVMYWPTHLMIVGPHGSFISYAYDTPARLVSEVDGLRVITSRGHELVSRVPDPVVAASRSARGGTSPAVALQDAAERFAAVARGSIPDDESDAALREARALESAIQTCVRAACHEFDAKRQAELLRAARFGNSYLQRKPRNVDCWALHKTCAMLRILNAARAPEVGIPLTYAQYRCAGLENLVKRLDARKHHLLASRVSEFTRGRGRVVERWAVSNVAASSEPDDAVLGRIKPKLESVRGMSHGKIALAAHRSGRRELARRLIDMEQNSSAQVSLLAAVGADEMALRKAIESRDADLMYATLLNLQRKMTFQDLASLLSRNPQAKALFVAFCRRTDVELLKSFFYSAGETARGVQALLSQVFRASDRDAEAYVWDETSASLCGQASMMYGKLKDAFHERVLDETQRLIRLGTETRVENALGGVPQKSLAAIVKRLVRDGDLKEARRIRVAFSMSDRHFCWLHATVLASKCDWRALEALANERNCPLGALTFLELGERFGAPKVELAKYLAKLPHTPQRAALYHEVGLEDRVTRDEAQPFATKAAGFFGGGS